MAETYTSNLGLTKPDYDSLADISVINSNMDKIDNAVANAGKVKSVNEKTGDVTLTAADVGALGKNEKAADANKLNGKDASEYASASDLALRIGAPDYVNFVTLVDETPTTAKETILETTMDADGYILLIFNTASATAAPYMQVLVNGTPATSYSQGDTPQTYIQRTSPIVPVKKGDTVKCLIYGVGATSNDLVAGGRRIVRFIPQRTGA